MDDLSSKINSILSDPQALAQIKGLGEKLMLNNTDDKIHKEEQNRNDVSSLLQNISGSNSSDAFNLISKLAPILSDINKEDDTTRLLSALKPFLSTERSKKLTEATKLIRLMKLLPLIKDFSLLDSLF